nr:MAG TPA: PsbA, PsbB, PsbC, PsbD, PsbE-FCP supercomplex, PLANT PROTEIN [Caudoviricetes sp.]
MDLRYWTLHSIFYLVSNTINNRNYEFNYISSIQ